jgi:2-dehydro-3-deoxyphosphogluconate aldolase/(4S)-4-hydroxy-2-oxoglutarate aldolase
VRVLPVVAPAGPEHAADLAYALATVGLAGVEVRAEGVAKLRATIGALLDAAPGLLVGAGLLGRAEQVHQAVAAGADFVATPAVDDEVIRCAHGLGASVLPVLGGYPDAIAAARESAPVVRLEVPDPERGLETVRRYARLFPRLHLVPSGPIGADDAGGYLGHPAVAAVATTRLQDAGDVGAFAQVARAHPAPG